jgi:undecaprenyl diphosphate synthase
MNKIADFLLPQHIAIVMDGNGRWAKKRFMPRVAGHRAGVEAARQIVKSCAERHINVLSLFAFSSENWHRPAAEVSYLMELFLAGLEREVTMLHEHHIRLRFIGDRSRFSQKLQQKIAEVERLTAQNTGMHLIIAADYGGQWDMTQALCQIALDIEAGKISSAAITPTLIASKLSCSDLPHPDFFIRTSGEQRISNFMLWQLAYTELYFTDTLWPDFDKNELDRALAYYASRERRFGHVSEDHHA